MLDLTDGEDRARLRAIPPPGYAIDLEPWERVDGGWRRLFTVRDWHVGHLRVTVGGEQAPSGVAVHWIFAIGDEELTARSDRDELTRILRDAGDLLDSLNQLSLCTPGLPTTPAQSPSAHPVGDMGVDFHGC